MGNTVKIIRKNQLVTNRWSGGTTTQLLIYPEDANYSERNFKWRISSANVENEESVFTHLPGISRIIMIIDGEIILEHEGKPRTALKPFEQHSFMGNWTTKSYGKVTDFNLMMSEGINGRLKPLSIEEAGTSDIALNEDNVNTSKAEKITNAFYVVRGDIILKIQGKDYDINEGDLVYITCPFSDERNELSFYNKGNKEAKIIRAVVCY